MRPVVALTLTLAPTIASALTLARAPASTLTVILTRCRLSAAALVLLAACRRSGTAARLRTRCCRVRLALLRRAWAAARRSASVGARLRGPWLSNASRLLLQLLPCLSWARFLSVRPRVSYGSSSSPRSSSPSCKATAWATSCCCRARVTSRWRAQWFGSSMVPSASPFPMCASRRSCSWTRLHGAARPSFACSSTRTAL